MQRVSLLLQEQCEQRRKIRQQTQALDNNLLSSDFKVVRNSFLLVFKFYLCWTPYVLLTSFYNDTVTENVDGIEFTVI